MSGEGRPARAAPGPTGAKPALRSQLVWRVVWPLVLSWGLGSVTALWLASRYVQGAYDRALLDDAYAIAAQVTVVDGRPRVALTSHELETLLYDHSERLYFALRTPGGGFLAGQAGVPDAPPLADAPYAFGDDHIRDRPVRVVTLRRRPDDPFIVVIAQTTEARRRLLSDLLATSAPVQVAFLLLTAWWLRRTIGRQLQPLGQLHDAVSQRDADDLSPLPAALAADAATRDIAHLGGALDALLAKLARSLAAQREFSGNVAHELRTPLAGIRAQAEFALAQDEPAQWRAQLEGILRSETRASHFVDQLLALARADEAQAALQLKAVALDELVQDAILRFLPRADALGVDLGVDLDGAGCERPVLVRGDATLIDGILNNLLDNALRHGRAAAPRVTVELARQPAAGDGAAGRVMLAVFDNGPGLPAGEHERVLARGAQGASRAPHGAAPGQGAGLGLAIVRRYAALLGARFVLEAAPRPPGLVARVWLDAGP